MLFRSIVVDRDAVLARVRASQARDHFARAGVDIEALATEYLQKPVLYGPDFSRTTLGEINTDLFPRDEFELAP